MGLDFVVIVLTASALALCVAGFMANSRKLEGSMKTPGFYWTWGTVAALAVSFITDAPWWSRVAGFGVLVATAWLWTKDEKAGNTR